MDKEPGLSRKHFWYYRNYKNTYNYIKMLQYCFPGLLTAFSHSDIKEPFKDPKFNFYKL